jgi:hypothetical protein
MADAFIAKGAKTVVGFSDYVKSSYCKNIGLNFFGNGTEDGTADDGLLKLTPEATTASDAWATSILTYGEDDADADPAEFLLRGSDDTNLNVATITNGDFEEGSTIGWTSSGDARVQAYVGDVSAPGGTYMGIISTGLGASTAYTVGDGSIIQQSLCVPAEVSTITFEYDVISEEPRCYVGSLFDDKFEVFVKDENGVELDISPGTLETVNTSDWEFLGGDYFYDGDTGENLEKCPPDSTDEVTYSSSDGTYHTGWKTGTIDVSDYAGAETPITVIFEVMDQGDSYWDTAVTIDNVQTNE